MSVSSVNITLFKKMVINGAINLKNNHKEINELNVFPVPDGDTGTNMSMTIMSGVRELNNCKSSSIIEVSKVLSRGALMGARGNSGVILSQFFRGFYVGLKDISTNELSIEQFMNCLDSGRKIAYKAVMSPVEGTILTVVRLAAEKTKEQLDTFKSIDDLLKYYYLVAKDALNDTPNLLPVLKEAGVVDSGGAGFIKIVEGMLLALKGEVLELLEDGDSPTASDAKLDSNIRFTYSVEFIVELKSGIEVNEPDLKSALSLIGDSLVLSKNNNQLKVHIDTNQPGDVLNLCQKFGEFSSIKIENMRQQTSNSQNGAKDIQNEAPKKSERKKNAVIAVAFGDGIVNTFKDLGVDEVIEGGQTMNPSTETFVATIKKCNADNIIIIPNNGNVIMAAKQAASMTRGSKIAVLKAKTIAQGYSAMMYYDPESDLDSNIENMSEAIENVKSGEVTYSIRDTEIGGVKIKANDHMGIMNGDIVVSTSQRLEALKELLEKMINDDSEIVTFFYGKDTPKEEVDQLEGLSKNLNKNIEIEIVNGKQDIYSYIVSVE